MNGIYGGGNNEGLTVVQLLGWIVDMDVKRLPVHRPPEVIAAVLDAPCMAIRIKSERHLVTDTIGQHGAFGVIVVSARGGLADIKRFHARAAGRGVRGGVIPIGVGTGRYEDDVRVLGGHDDRPRGVYPLADSRDDRLLAGYLARRGVVGP